MEQLIRQLREKGYKLTSTRRELLRCLDSAQQPYTAEDIHRQLQAVRPGTDLATIYRNLDLLVRLRLVTKLEFNEGRYRYELISGRSHHDHLVCTSCGGVSGLFPCALKDLEGRVYQEKGFQAHEHSLVVYGICQECQDS